MLRLVVVASLVLAVFQSDAAQTSSILHLKVSLAGVDGTPAPVARHALLVGDDPPTAAPRRVVTAADGTAQMRLRPGKYLIESEKARAWEGRAYEWRQVVDIAAGRDATLELTAANAEVGGITSDSEVAPVPSKEPPAPAPAPAETTPSNDVEI